MAMVKEGDTIKIHYTGKLEDGTVFDSSKDTEPLQFTIGAGKMLPGLETGVIGMSAGESKSITIPADQAYGQRVEEKVFQFDRKNAPENFCPEVGQQLQMYRADGKPLYVTVVGMSDASVTMDANHPLAGKTLIFDTTLVEII